MLLIVSDLDGTLLDRGTYSAAAAVPVVERLRRAGVPLVLCSSKTRAEIEALMARFAIDEPFISENGGAIYLPRASFSGIDSVGRQVGTRLRIELGRPYGEVVAIVRAVAAAQRVQVRGFADMTIADISQECRLPPLEAQLAKLREYDEPFRMIDADARTSSRFMRVLHRRGLRTVQGGRYYHATGDTDKGVAVKVLRPLLARRGPVVLAGLGDAPNDIALLRAVDIPVIVRSEDSGATTARLLRKVPTATVTDRPGPAGWAEAVSRIVDQWEAGLIRPGSATLRP